MRPVTVTVGPLASASTNNICTSQTPSSAGLLTLNGSTVTGGVAVLDEPRTVLITTAAAISFTITGTDVAGNIISETVTNSGSSVASVLSYKTVTSIANSASAGGQAITVGTNGTASSAWVRFDHFAQANVAIQCTAGGTVNYTIQSTLDDPNLIPSTITPAAMTWVNTSDTSGVNATGTIQSNFLFTPTFARIYLNSGTGTVTATFSQSGMVPY